MKKSVLIGAVAFGGLLLTVALLGGSKEDNSIAKNGEEAVVLSIPTDLPDFPTYPNSEVRSVRDTDGEDSRDVSITLASTDSVKEINDWYREALSGGGWSIKSDKNVAGYQIIQGENNDLYTSMQATGSGEVIISQHLKVRK
ncbi:MAG: hypothetical protein R3B53_04710 [Candidatus Paceibacterota bacterium]